MRKSVFEELDAIYEEEQLKIAIDKLPIKGKWDPQNKCVVIQGPPPDDADEWDEIYRKTSSYVI